MNNVTVRRIVLTLLSLVALAGLRVLQADVVSASTYMNFVSQTPMNPTDTQSVTVIFDTDTALGETVRIVWTTATVPNTPPDPVPATGAGTACSFLQIDPSQGYDWTCTIPAMPKDTVVKYTGFVTNQSNDYYGVFNGPHQYTVTGPNAASYSRKSVSRSHGLTTVRWYSSLRVIGFDVYDGHTRLNHRVVTSHTFWYRFSTHLVIRHLRIVALWPALHG